MNIHITIADLGNAGLTYQQVKLLFKSCNIDYARFLEEGIDSIELDQIDNAIIQQMVTTLVARQSGDRSIVMVTRADARKAKLCSKGTREFFKNNKLDYSVFLTEGIPVKVMESIKSDAMEKAIDQAVIREGVDHE